MVVPEYGGDGDIVVVRRGAVRARVFSAFLIVDRCLVRRVRHSQQPSTRTLGGNKRYECNGIRGVPLPRERDQGLL